MPGGKAIFENPIVSEVFYQSAERLIKEGGKAATEELYNFVYPEETDTSVNSSTDEGKEDDNEE